MLKVLETLGKSKQEPGIIAQVLLTLEPYQKLYPRTQFFETLLRAQSPLCLGNGHEVRIVLQYVRA